MGQSLRNAVAKQINALAKKIVAWESTPGDHLAGIALMKQQVLRAHSALEADDVLALLAIKEEITKDHTNLDAFK